MSNRALLFAILLVSACLGEITGPDGDGDDLRKRHARPPSVSSVDMVQPADMSSQPVDMTQLVDLSSVTPDLANSDPSLGTQATQVIISSTFRSISVRVKFTGDGNANISAALQ